MKKIYLSLLASTLFFAANAQKPQVTSAGNCEVNNNLKERQHSKLISSPSEVESAYKVNANVPIHDSNYYFFNKHFFRNAPPNHLSFPTFKNAPTYTSATFPQRWGAVFLNSGSLEVVGAEILTFAQTNSSSSNVNVGVYLYNVSGGVPTGAPINSMVVAVPQSTAGDFHGANFPTPSTVSGDFAIIFKNISPVNQDTIRVFFTNAKTPTSTATANEKFGEGLGIVGTQSNFFVMTGVFSPTNTTDYEPIVAPIVNYTVTANHNFTSTTICNTDNITYVNTSSAWINHRQYNMNRFWKHWAPFGNTAAFTQVTTNNLLDSVYTWDFGDGSPFKYAESPSHTYGMNTGAMNANLSAKIRKQGTYMFAMDVKTWNVTVNVCNVGLTENNLENQFKLYPNPANNEVSVYLNNANDNSQISILNALGQVVLTQKANAYKNTVNIQSLAKGVYFVRVSDGKQSSTSKLVIEK